MAAENARLKRQLAEKEQEVAILKKASAYFAKTPHVKYAFMEQHHGRVFDRPHGPGAAGVAQRLLRLA